MTLVNVRVCRENGQGILTLCVKAQVLRRQAGQSAISTSCANIPAVKLIPLFLANFAKPMAFVKSSGRALF